MTWERSKIGTKIVLGSVTKEASYEACRLVRPGHRELTNQQYSQVTLGIRSLKHNTCSGMLMHIDGGRHQQRHTI